MIFDPGNGLTLGRQHAITRTNGDTYCQLHLWEQTSMNLWEHTSMKLWRYVDFLSRKCNYRCHLQNGRHFSEFSTCSGLNKVQVHTVAMELRFLKKSKIRFFRVFLRNGFISFWWSKIVRIIIWFLSLVALGYNRVVPTVMASLWEFTWWHNWKMRYIMKTPGISLGMRPANERHHYIVTMSLIGWAHT